jgi:hypothetical protein
VVPGLQPAGGRCAGGSLRLLQLVEEHRPALAFDFRDRIHNSLSAIGDTIAYGEAWDLVTELANEFGTHTHASVHKWEFPARFGELIAVEHAEWTANRYRDREKAPEPITFPRPWRDESYVEPEERERLLAVLERERQRLFGNRDE